MVDTGRKVNRFLGPSVALIIKYPTYDQMLAVTHPYAYASTADWIEAITPGSDIMRRLTKSCLKVEI
jgi:hypothetical protein